MAKSVKSSKRKVAVFSIRGWDAKHYKMTAQYTKAVERIMDAATEHILSVAAKGETDPDKMFSFADSPKVQRQVNAAIEDMVSQMQVTIEKGSRKEWLQACQKSDAFLGSIMDTSKLSKKRLSQFQDKNLNALAAFQSRKVNGMNLSERIWNYADQYKAQMELAIDVGLGSGRSPAELSRDVRANLKDPNRLYRRVRDKHGNLVLSKNARAFNPGQGVYRSSYKNAMRLARSEINMAYRESDYLRWQQLDFVVGIEVHRSNHKPLFQCDLCEKLKGRYPKDFKFKGWHPQCMCYATPILCDDDEFDAKELSDLKSALNGTEYKKMSSKNKVTDVPDGFKNWVDANIVASKNWKSTPYFIKDNFVDGALAKGLKLQMEQTAASKTPVPEVRIPYDELDNEARQEWLQFKWDNFQLDYYWESACKDYTVAGIDEYAIKLKTAINNDEYWKMNELRADFIRLDNALQAAIADAKAECERLIDIYVQKSVDAEKWIGSSMLKNRIQNAHDYISSQQAEKYPNYFSLKNSFTTGYMSFPRLQKEVDAAKTLYNNTIISAKDTIAKYGKETSVAQLELLINETMSGTRPAVGIAADINKTIKEVERAARGVAILTDQLEKDGVQSQKVTIYKKQPTEEDLIDKVGGGDMTSGSCSSLAFAWAANRGGMRVYDFRDGLSREFFASGINIRKICDEVGGVQGVMTGVQAMKKTEVGKEYYLAIGKHAAIVRQVAPKKYEYLELQSNVAGQNGWHELNASVFADRFSARGSQYAELIDIELLYKAKGYKELMSYINTKKSDQNKGKSGSIK